MEELRAEERIKEAFIDEKFEERYEKEKKKVLVIKEEKNDDVC